MKQCPLCLELPSWNLARNVSQTRKADHWIFYGCKHARELGTEPIANPDKDAKEARWEATAERLFADYTSAWEEVNRLVFRERIWPTPPPVVPTELFDRRHDEKPTPRMTAEDIERMRQWNLAHPASDEAFY